MKNVLIGLFAVMTGLCSLSARADSFTDGFEGSSIDPFWTLTGPGTATLTNTMAHSGAQSVELTASTSFPWAINMVHDFGSDQTGSVSVWIQGESLCCDSGAALELDNKTGFASFMQSGNINDPTNIAVRVNGPDVADFHTSASDWHHYEIDVAPTGVTFTFDGSTVLTDHAFTKFQSLELTVFGGPGGTAFMDDFSVNTQPAVPEPASAALLLTAMSAILLGKRRCG